MRLYRQAALALSGVFVGACGGADFTLGASDAGSADVVSASPGDATMSGDDGPAGGGGVDATPGRHRDAGAAADAGGDDAAAASDASMAGEQCGALSCAALDVCCVYTSGGGGAPQYSCDVACSPPPNGQVLSSLGCVQTSDCAFGTVCCIERVNNDNRSACAPSCTSNQAQLCDPATSTGECPANAPCSTTNIFDWGLPRTFATCGGVSVP